MDRVRRFRESAAVENQGRQRLGWRYSADLKALGVAHCRARREDGGSYAEIAEELGISALTLSRWLESGKPSASAFRPVEVVAEPGSLTSIEAGSLRVILPTGLRIEGLVWPQVLELARVLG